MSDDKTNREERRIEPGSMSTKIMNCEIGLKRLGVTPNELKKQYSR